MLKLPSTLSKAEKQERVQTLIKDLGLETCRHTLIGGPMTGKGVSGGERKRVCLAVEMITNPPILFLGNVLFLPPLSPLLLPSYLLACEIVSDPVVLCQIR
jgi:ABC-type lipopolysaccharide export system ATPase subunit